MKKLACYLSAVWLLAGLPTQAQPREPIAEELRSKIAAIVIDSDAGVGTPVLKDNYAESALPSRCEAKTGADGRPCYEIEIRQSSRSQYEVCWQWRAGQPIAKGDVLLARLTMRTLEARQESGESAVYAYFQEGHEPYSKSFNTQLGTGREWKTFELPFVAHKDFAADEGVLELALSSLCQQLEICGVTLYNFGKNIGVEELPVTRFSYLGREADAAWRKEALARIETLRTAPLSVSVTDAAGKPVRGAEVEIAMVQSDFIWGTAVNAGTIVSDDAASEQYRQHLTELFNTAVIENGLKAPAWDSERRGATVRAFEWLEANGFRQRGHNLVWPGWKFNAAVTKEIAERDPAIFDRYIRAQFYERMALTKGRVIAWDVINELLHEKDFFTVLPDTAAADWFKLAKELDPDAQLFINDYAMLNCVQSPQNIAAYIELIQSLRSQGAPIEAIGVQGHIGRQPRNPEQVLSDLDLFLPTGLPVQLTEFDINSPDEELQTDYLRDFLIAVYSHPAVTGVTLWGFWEARHWKPDAGMFRRDWSPKGTAAVWRELVTGAWKTHKTVATDKHGAAEVRGHFGTYRVRVTHKGVTKTAECHLQKGGEQLQLVL